MSEINPSQYWISCFVFFGRILIRSRWWSVFFALYVRIIEMFGTNFKTTQFTPLLRNHQRDWMRMRPKIQTVHEIQYWLGFISDMNLWTNRTYLFIIFDWGFFLFFARFYLYWRIQKYCRIIFDICSHIGTIGGPAVRYF